MKHPKKCTEEETKDAKNRLWKRNKRGPKSQGGNTNQAHDYSVPEEKGSSR